MLILELIQNVAFVVAIGSIYRVMMARMDENSLQFKLIAGLLFAGAGVMGMMTPFLVLPGIIFDGRSIILSVAGLFGGPLAAGVAAAICAAYRIYLGGGGTGVGVSVIGMSAALGVVFYYLRQRGKIRYNPPMLWGIGMLVHLIMFGLFQFLPDGAGPRVVREVGLMILLAYPLAGVFVSLLFLDTETQIQNRKELHETAVALSKAQKVAHVGSWMWHIQEDRLEWSDEMYRIFGINKEKFAGKLSEVIGKAIHPDDRERVNESNRKVAEEKNPSPLEYRIVREDGTVRTVWAEAGELILDKYGKPQLLTGIVQDVTERRKAEEELRESENRYRNLILNSPDAIFVNHDGKIELVNQACLKLFGAEKAEELLDKSVLDLFHPRYHAQVRSRIETLVNQHEPVPLVEEQIIRLDGRAVDVDVIAAPFDYRGVVDIHVILRDITERKKMENALRANEEYLESMIASSPMPVYSLDPDGRVVTWNPAAEQVLGWRKEEVIGQTLPIVPVEKQAEFAGMLARVMAGERLGGMRVIRQKRDGSPFVARVYASPLHNSANETIGIISFLEDITERNRAEEELKISEERFRAMVEGAPDTIFIQVERKFAFINAKGMALFGAKQANDLIGTPVMERFHPDFHQVAGERIRILNEDKKPVTTPLDLKFVRLDGSEVWVETTGQPIVYQGRHGALVFVRDITERKSAENRIEEQLHELRRWYSGMIGREKRTLELKQEVNELLRQAGLPARYLTGEAERGGKSGGGDE